MFNFPKIAEKTNFSAIALFRCFPKNLFPILSFSFFLEKSRKDQAESIFVQFTPGAFYVITSYFLIIFIFLQLAGSLIIYLRDQQASEGSKENQKLFSFFFWNYAIYFFFLSFFYLGNFLIPFSLDTLNNSSQKILGNFWIYSKILNFEANVLIGLLIFYQFPALFSFFFHEEKRLQDFSGKPKELILSSFLVGAWVTPSIDPITQIGCTFLTLFLSIFCTNWAQKKGKKKYLGSNFIN